MSQPHTYENSLRVHDQAVYDWFDDLRVDYGKLGDSAKPNYPILRIFASPTRSFAPISKMLVARGFISAADAEDMRAKVSKSRDFSVFPLPILTIERGMPRPDPERSGVPKVIRKMWLNPATGLWEQHRYPGHYLTEYTCSFWCHKQYTAAYIQEWIFSRLGQLGAQENEVFIPVQHDGPWGTQRQMFRMETSSDNSELEGENPRWIRFDFMFTLRTWIMREPVQTAAPIGDTLVTLCNETGDGTYPDQPEIVGTLPPQLITTENLFAQPFAGKDIETRWPTTGRGKASQPVVGEHGQPQKGLQIQVNGEDDSAALGEWSMLRDTDGYGIMSTSLRYNSTDDTVIEVAQRDALEAPEDVTSADLYELPASGRKWVKVHRFSIVSEPNAITSVVGVDDDRGPRTVHLDQIDIRLLHPATKLPETSQDAVPGGTQYSWTGLAPKPYLLIFILASTGGAVVTIEASNDSASPSHTDQRTVEDDVQVGGVFLLQPLSTTLALTVPTGTTLASAYAVEYAGAYDGNAV